jgi:hypothetical protein
MTHINSNLISFTSQSTRATARASNFDIIIQNFIFGTIIWPLSHPRHRSIRVWESSDFEKNSSRVADPRNSTVEQLHRGSGISQNVWYNSRFYIISMTFMAHKSGQ